MLLGPYLEQGAEKMKLRLSRRAVHHWLQTAQLDRDGAQCLPYIGRGLSLEFDRLFIAAARDGSQENRVCLDGHAGAAEASDFHQRFDRAASGRRHSRASSKRYRGGADRVKEQLPAHTRHQRYPQHRKTRGRTDTALVEHILD